MTKDCLELIYDEVKEKSQGMDVWKGSRKTKTGKLQEKYIEKRKQLAKLIAKEQLFCVYSRQTKKEPKS